jgi:hypothetical protein
VVGQWEDITPASVTLSQSYTGALMVLENPRVSGSLYLTTSLNGVFRSSNCGSTWNNVGTDPNITHSAGAIWTAVVDPVDPNTLYVNDGYAANGIWKSTDGGSTWTALTLPPNVPSFIEGITGNPNDPNDHLHLVATLHDNCSAPNSPVCFIETMDGGDTWRVIQFGLQDNWAEGAAVLMLDATHWLYSNGGFYATSDGGGTWAPVPNNPLPPAVGCGPSYFKAASTHPRHSVTARQLSGGPA